MKVSKLVLLLVFIATLVEAGARTLVSVCVCVCVCVLFATAD